MKRTEFLEKCWNPYPVAASNWIDVEGWLSGDANSAVVCGRLQIEGDDFSLTSNGQVLKLPLQDLQDSIRWLQPNRNDIAFTPSLLIAGDLIAVLVSVSGDRKRVKVDAALLLVPCRQPLHLNLAFTHERSTLWAKYVAGLREFFTARGFVEAATPTLVSSPGTEPFLDAFSTEWNFGALAQTYYLPTSPEFHLKKMLVHGWTKVFEIQKCYRNSEISELHQPEFWMLEWYRAYANLDAIADDTELLIEELVKTLTPAQSVPKLVRTTMRELFAEAFDGFVLRPTTSLAELRELALRKGISFSATDTWDEVFFRLFLERIERDLGKQGPILVRGYPPSQAALSRIGEDGFADRFEIYWNGIEIANAFHELNDPQENEKRFLEDAKTKTLIGKAEVPIDVELVRNLYAGLPPSGGIALGVDRLFMALFGLEKISETRAFPLRIADEV